MTANESGRVGRTVPLQIKWNSTSSSPIADRQTIIMGTKEDGGSGLSMARSFGRIAQVSLFAVVFGATLPA